MELADYGYARSFRKCAEPAGVVLLPRDGSGLFQIGFGNPRIVV